MGRIIVRFSERLAGLFLDMGRKNCTRSVIWPNIFQIMMTAFCAPVSFERGEVVGQFDVERLEVGNLTLQLLEQRTQLRNLLNSQKITKTV